MVKALIWGHAPKKCWFLSPFLGAGYWACSSVLLSGICRNGVRPVPLEPRPVPAMKWFTDDQAGLPQKGRGGLSDLMLGPYATCSGGPVGIQLSGPLNWKGRRKPGDLDTWTLSPGPEREKEGCGSTWSLAAFLGQGRERKYVKRVAPGLAIWAEMPAARVGVRKEEPGPGPGSWILVFPRVRALSFGGSRPGEEAQDAYGSGNLGGKQVSAAMFGINL